MHPIGDLLTSTNVLSLEGTDNVMSACKAMDERGVGAVLVHFQDSEAEGIFTERDLMVRVVVEGLDPNVTRLEDVCSRGLYTAGPDDSASHVREEMHRRHIRHVPVMLDGKVLGVLSMRDLLHANLREKTQEIEAITNYIQGGLPTDDA